MGKKITNIFYNLVFYYSEACGIESAARQNPNLQIFAIFFSSVGFMNVTPLPLVDAVLSYANVHLNKVDAVLYTNDTPIGHLISDGVILESSNLAKSMLEIMKFVRYVWKIMTFVFNKHIGDQLYFT